MPMRVRSYTGGWCKDCSHATYYDNETESWYHVNKELGAKCEKRRERELPVAKEATRESISDALRGVKLEDLG